MTTLTREWLKSQISSIEAVGITDSNTLQAFKIALAAMQQEPVDFEAWWNGPRWPEPLVERALKDTAREAWNAAILKGKAEPVSNRDELNSPVIQDGWISCGEWMPGKLIPVMVMYADGEMWSAMWTGTEWDDGTEFPDPHAVTYWREMPAAPQQ